MKLGYLKHRGKDVGEILYKAWIERGQAFLQRELSLKRHLGEAPRARGSVQPHVRILKLAGALGVDPKSEYHLFWVLQQCLSTPLPPHWSLCEDGRYFNDLTGKKS